MDGLIFSLKIFDQHVLSVHKPQFNTLKVGNVGLVKPIVTEGLA